MIEGPRNQALMNEKQGVRGGSIVLFAQLSNVPLHITAFSVSFLAKVYSLICARGTIRRWQWC